MGAVVKAAKPLGYYDKQFADGIEGTKTDTPSNRRQLEETATELVDELASSFHDMFVKSTPRLMFEERDGRVRSRNMIYDRWKRPFELVTGFIAVNAELSEMVQAYHRDLIWKDGDQVISGAMISAHVRAVRCSNEILSLMEAGHADGAYARWRTLHELSVVARFLAQSPPIVSERYIHWGHYLRIKALHAHDLVTGSNDRVDTEGKAIDLQDELLRMQRHFGEGIKADYGWAKPAINSARPRSP